MSPRMCGHSGLSWRETSSICSDRSTSVSDIWSLRCTATWPPPQPRSSTSWTGSTAEPKIATRRSASSAYSSAGEITGHHSARSWYSRYSVTASMLRRRWPQRAARIGSVPAMTELTWLDATAQAELVRQGEVSAAELVEAAIGRIEAVNPRLDAVIRTRYDQARAEAAGDVPDGPFRGVPVLFKDLGCEVEGEATAFGLGPMRDVPWPVTSYLAEAFRAAGFVALGRTNVPEMGTTVTTEARSFPAARNPWDPGRSAGGSSGGSAAAVAGGMVPAAHGNDGGGSIRIPSSECGLVGLKPTRARVSQGPMVGEAWAGGTIDGVLTRTVRDAAGILDVISTGEPGDPYYAPPLPRPLRDEVGADPGRLRVGVLDRPGAVGYLDDPQCREAVAGAARLLEKLGHDLSESVPEAMFDELFGRHFARVIAADTEATFRAFEAMLGRPITEDEIEPRTVGYRRAGAALDAVTS